MQPAATILIVKSGISNHAASGILDELCLSKFGTFHAACPQPADNFRTYVQHLPCSRIKHNRAKPMFESASAIFSIADAGEFRVARFYIVYEEVPLGTPESPLIVCGLSDTLRECPNVEETRNSMQTFSWKKYSHFSPTNIPSTFPSEIPRCDLLIILLITSRGVAGLKWQPLIERYSRFRCFVMILAHTRYKMTMTMIE